MRGLPLILQLLVILADEVSANARLEVGQDRRQPVISPLFELTEDAGFEEDLGVTETILIAEVQRRQHLLRRHFAVHETGWNHVGSQDRISTKRKCIQIDRHRCYNIRCLGTFINCLFRTLVNALSEYCYFKRL